MKVTTANQEEKSRSGTAYFIIAGVCALFFAISGTAKADSTLNGYELNKSAQTINLERSGLES